jgi:homoserine dehydrogenase
LRSIASIDVKTKSIQIRILEVPNQHAFAVSPPGCSCVRFFTRRHERYPLIIQGPSAGADSTASALLAELLQRTRGISTPRSLSLVRRGSSGVFLDIKHSASA